MNINIPELIFIIPYRDRRTHKFFFSRHMEYILEGFNYEIYFSHQDDKMPFNRGASKNIGFLAIKDKYPDHYKSMTFIFHDIDTLPFDKIIEYKTQSGVVKHFYGFENALGGIFSILGEDFETILGFPTFWGWGMEDFVIYKRCNDCGLTINREQFYPIGSPEILHLFDGIQRIINPSETEIIGKNIENINLSSLSKIKYSIDKESSNPLDNIFVTENEKIMFINITNFETLNRITDNFFQYDIRQPIEKICSPNPYSQKKINLNKLNEVPKWNVIPYYPNKNVKEKLIKNYGSVNTEKIIEYNSQYSKNPLKLLLPNDIKLNNVPLPISIFSPYYRNYVGQKPKATKSANIGLGGVY